VRVIALQGVVHQAKAWSNAAARERPLDLMDDFNHA
jgi:hypothetical protein